MYQLAVCRRFAAPSASDVHRGFPEWVLGRVGGMATSLPWDVLPGTTLLSRSAAFPKVSNSLPFAI